MAFSIDPAVFRSESISAETHAFNSQLEAALKDLPPNYTRNPQDIRDARERGEGIFGPLQLSEEAVDRTIRTAGGDIPVRVFTPDRVEAVYFHIHGGGWVLGRAHHQDPRLSAISARHNLAVVSVDYRLAPEHPYPAGPDDCEAAATWLIDRCRSEFGTDRLLIGGESAGAHLAAVTLLRMRDKHRFTGFLGANLVYGVYDLRLTPSARNWGTRELILSTPTIQWFVDQFVPDESMRTHPDISPVYADLTGMPPALFTVGTMDPLLDDSLFMAAKWAGFANEAQLAVYPGGIHGLNALPNEVGRQANLRIDEFLQSVLAPVPA